MQVKFQNPIENYSHLIMFDLATRVTGVCIWDISTQRPIYTNVIRVADNAELPVVSLYNELDRFFKKVEEELHIDLAKVLIYQEAMPAQLRGGSSTVQTFISLARSHAILDLYTSQHGLAIYDYSGVYPVSTHSYLRKTMGLDNKYKIDKQYIKDYIEIKYDLRYLSYDEADAILLAETFINSKWDKDIDEEMRNIRKHIKDLKDSHRIESLQKELDRLSHMQLHTK